MKHIARSLTALALVALATPALPCGFDKSHSTTTTAAPAPAGNAPVAKADKDKAAKTQKAKAPTQEKVTAAN